MIIAPGSTDVTTYFKLIDPTAGTPEVGLTITDLDATYIRDRAAAVKADLTALVAVDSAHGDNKAIQVDATNAPGLYRVDWPDAAFAAGVGRVQLVVNGAAIDPAVIEVELVPWLTPITGATVRAVDGSDAALMASGSTVDANLVSILGSAVSGTAAWLAAAFSKFFNKETPTGTVNSLPDAVAGASGGVAIVGSAMTLTAAYDAAKLAAPTGAAMTLAAGAVSAAAIATGAIDADALAADAGTEIGTAVWASATRTLTSSAAATTSTVSGSAITGTRGDTLTASLTGLGEISSRSKLWFTVKEEQEDTDAQAIVQIEETDGLKYINGAAAGTSTNGSITVTDATTGALTITLKPAETDDLAVGQYKYDIQQLTSGGVVTTLTSGVFEVVADITRAVA